ncbi:hypothetical protein ASF06_18060 [Agreia sp. Leaf244]|uniref:TetR/AcrR family transcriptional regulator C-terminal domain-containing protein n=1 Tax=Agreia sp. Leaf244 TaxID=1736305 RepID=UPI00070060F9|nr:TetR/AcrR family transcriptional regulator C-terminal domain-containing protein [Agreia sp. Leaf244]KQO05398.1 hypothetical protein ASF06_18060 [Agreia sp. Leaf244]
MAAKRHNRDDVVRGAFAVLDESGIEAVTLRGVAKRMGLHQNSVTFQVTSKAFLFELMAEVILGELSLDDLPEKPPERIAEVSKRLRLAMLSHRDGGRVIGGTDTADANALAYADVTISAFLEAGVSAVIATRASVALHCLIIGLVEEEQAERPNPRRHHISPDDYPGLAHIGGLLDEDSYTERAAFGIEALINQALLTAEVR